MAAARQGRETRIPVPHQWRTPMDLGRDAIFWTLVLYGAPVALGLLAIVRTLWMLLHGDADGTAVATLAFVGVLAVAALGMLCLQWPYRFPAARPQRGRVTTTEGGVNALLAPVDRRRRLLR